jgi:hypothetical protein
MAKAVDGRGKIRASSRKRALKQKGSKDMLARSTISGLNQREQTIRNLERTDEIVATKVYHEGEERMLDLAERLSQAEN